MPHHSGSSNKGNGYHGIHVTSYKANTEYEVIRVRQANLIATDGTIAPPPVGARRREANDEKPAILGLGVESNAHHLSERANH